MTLPAGTTRVTSPYEAELVLTRDAEGVRTITLNRPEKLNALNVPLSAALHAALTAADQDDTVHVIVLNGAGRGFCAGGDLSEFRNGRPSDFADVEGRSRLISRTHVLIKTMRQPVIASVHGFALGGGAALAVACDLVVVAEDLQFSYPETRNGIVPALVMPGVQRAIGRKKGFELLALAPTLDGESLVRFGLANYSVLLDELAPTTDRIARQLAAMDPAVVAQTKMMFHRMADLSERDAIELSCAVNGLEQLKKLAMKPEVRR